MNLRGHFNMRVPLDGLIHWFCILEKMFESGSRRTFLGMAVAWSSLDAGGLRPEVKRVSCKFSKVAPVGL